MDDFKEKAKNTIDAVAEKTMEIAGQATEVVKNYARIAKLTLEIGGERDVIKKAYAELGKLYYSTYKDEAQGFFVSLCDEITMAMDSISAKELEIAELKAGAPNDEDEACDCEDEDCDCEDEACDCADEPEAEDAPAGEPKEE